jgi:hypothetical protein
MNAKDASKLFLVHFRHDALRPEFEDGIYKRGRSTFPEWRELFSLSCLRFVFVFVGGIVFSVVSFVRHVLWCVCVCVSVRLSFIIHMYE